MDYISISVAALIVSVVGVLWQYFGVILRLKDEVHQIQDTLKSDVGKVKERLIRLETKTDLFWKTVEENVPRLLMHPHTARRDELLLRMSDGQLNASEIAELLHDLESSVSQEPRDLQLATILLIVRLKHRLADHETEAAQKVKYVCP